MTNIKKPLIISLAQEAREDPKSLTHVLTDGSNVIKYDGEDRIPESRKDLEIFEKLKEGSRIQYRPHTSINEFAASIVPWNLEKHPHGPYGCSSPSARGVIYFNNGFYDRICSPQVDSDVLIELFKLTYTLYGRMVNSSYNRQFDDCFLDEDISVERLESMIKTVNGVPTSEFIEGGRIENGYVDGYYRLYMAIYSIMGLRHGKPSDELRSCEDVSPKENPFEYASLKANHDSDYGIRAVELRGDGDLRSLSYGLDDIKYFVSFDGGTQENAKLLIGSPME